MKKKILKEDLVELRKKELSRKELEFQIGRDLKHEYVKKDAEEREMEGKSPLVIGIINFLGTVLILYFGYLIFWLFSKQFLFFIPSTITGPFFILLHAIIFLAGVISVFKKRSVLDIWFFK